MRKFQVKAFAKSGTYTEILEAENQRDALMRTLRLFSKDGIHVGCSISITVIPYEE